MNLPIDARTAPIKPKYIEDETSMFNRWMIFGVEKDGTVHVSDATDDVLIGLTHEQAMRVISARERFVDEVVHVLNPEWMAYVEANRVKR